ARVASSLIILMMQDEPLEQGCNRYQKCDTASGRRYTNSGPAPVPAVIPMTGLPIGTGLS
ncbi:unnamed protein product, partial [Didymodactylos carnosus]